MEKLLLFGTDDDQYQKIKQIASRLKLSCTRVSPDGYRRTLGEIAAGNCGESVQESSVSLHSLPPSAEDFPESLLVICNLTDKRMDKLLFELRRAKVGLDYKAALTPTNAAWTVPRLMLDLRAEKAALTHR